MINETALNTLFNSSIETGQRALVIITAGYPNQYDIGRLVFYDYLLVHSGDIPNAPESLHPETPHRSGEVLVRKPLIESGLKLMIARGLIDCNFTNQGISYCASEQAIPFLDVLNSIYIEKLKLRAQWLVTQFDDIPYEKLKQLFRENIDKWGGEFIYESVLKEQFAYE